MGVKKLEKHGFSNSLQSVSDNIPEKNLFLIDWLTFTAHGESVDSIKDLLGMPDEKIPWLHEEKFMNGYPCRYSWNGIMILYGADMSQYYDDPTKATTKMGICVNMSGSGCRTFETYGSGDWSSLFGYLTRDVFAVLDDPDISYDGYKAYNITRLDLAFDDHEGVLDIYQIEADTYERNFTSNFKQTEVIRSDDLKTDIVGLNVQFGSNSSLIKLRIYDKAAERHIKNLHWVRSEMQLRGARASNAIKSLVGGASIGDLYSGIVSNYLVFRVPGNDLNKSRWEIAEYWIIFLDAARRISLLDSPGMPYNIDHSISWMVKQYGPLISTIYLTQDPGFLYESVKDVFPYDRLAPKYKNIVDSMSLRKE